MHFLPKMGVLVVVIGLFASSLHAADPVVGQNILAWLKAEKSDREIIKTCFPSIATNQRNITAILNYVHEAKPPFNVTIDDLKKIKISETELPSIIFTQEIIDSLGSLPTENSHPERSSGGSPKPTGESDLSPKQSPLDAIEGENIIDYLKKNKDTFGEDVIVFIAPLFNEKNSRKNFGVTKRDIVAYIKDQQPEGYSEPISVDLDKTFTKDLIKALDEKLIEKGFKKTLTTTDNNSSATNTSKPSQNLDLAFAYDVPTITADLNNDKKTIDESKTKLRNRELLLEDSAGKRPIEKLLEIYRAWLIELQSRGIDATLAETTAKNKLIDQIKKLNFTNQKNIPTYIEVVSDAAKKNPAVIEASDLLKLQGKFIILNDIAPANNSDTKSTTITDSEKNRLKELIKNVASNEYKEADLRWNMRKNYSQNVIEQVVNELCKAPKQTPKNTTPPSQSAKNSSSSSSSSHTGSNAASPEVAAVQSQLQQLQQALGNAGLKKRLEELNAELQQLQQAVIRVQHGGGSTNNSILEETAKKYISMLKVGIPANAVIHKIKNDNSLDENAKKYVEEQINSMQKP